MAKMEGCDMAGLDARPDKEEGTSLCPEVWFGRPPFAASFLRVSGVLAGKGDAETLVFCESLRNENAGVC